MSSPSGARAHDTSNLELAASIEYLNQLLDDIRDKLPTDPQAEFGDDRDSIRTINDRLEHIKEHLDQILHPKFALSTTSLSVANPFFGLMGDCDMFTSELANIQQTFVASLQHHKTLVRRLQELWGHLAELWRTAKLQKFPYEDHLQALLTHVHQLQPDPKRDEYLLGYIDRLARAWQQGNGQDIPAILARLDHASHQLLGKSLRSLVEAASNLQESDDLIVPSVRLGMPIEACWCIIAGVGQYDDDDVYSSLPHAARDANAVAALLRTGARGYTDERLRLFCSYAPEDDLQTQEIPAPATMAAVLDAVAFFAEQASADDLIMFYFSGHGALHQQEPYLICQDTMSRVVERTGLPMVAIKAALQSSQARVKIIILDTCYSGSILNGVKNTIEPMDPEYIRLVCEDADGFIIMTSCDANQLSFPYDETKKTSAFTHFILEYLKTGGKESQSAVTVQSLKSFVSSKMQQWSLSKRRPQRPRFAIHTNGDPIIADWRPLPEEATL